MQNSNIDKILLYQQYIKLEAERQTFKLTGKTDAILDYAEYSIRAQFDKGSKQNLKNKKRKGQEILQEQFLTAYTQLSSIQKLQHYIRTVKFIKQKKEGTFHEQKKYTSLFTQEAYTRSYNLKIWKKKILRLDREKNHIFCQRQQKVKLLELNNYIIRQSKNKQYYCFVLGALNDKPHHKSRTVHIGFKDPQIFQIWFCSVREGIIEMERKRILKQIIPIFSLTQQNSHDDKTEIDKKSESIIIDVPTRHQNELFVQNKRKISQNDQPIQKKQQLQEKKILLNNQQVNKDIKQLNKKQQIIDKKQQQLTTPITLDLIDKQQQFNTTDQLIEKIQQIQTKQQQNKLKKNLNLLIHILPDYQISNLPTLTADYQLIFEQQTNRLYRNKNILTKYKLFFKCEQQYQERLYETISQIDTYTKWNTAIEDASIKNLIRSQNTAIIYQKHKPYSKIYRARDFLFLRHVFKINNNLYLIDKSIENSNYPPFMTIVRGNLLIIWGILKQAEDITMIADIQIKNQGILNATQDHNLSLSYLKGIFNLKGYLSHQLYKKQENLHKIFDLDWDIGKNDQNKQVQETIRKKRLTFQKQRQQSKKIENQFIQPQNKLHLDNISSPFKKNEIKILQGVVTDQSQRIKKQRKQSINEKKGQNPKKALQNIQEQKGQIQSVSAITKKIQTGSQIKYDFDEKGLVKIPQDYLKHRYQFFPTSSLPILYQQVINGNAIWKGEWKFDTKQGGIIFINQKKIQQQKGVLKYILTKIGKNLISGKSVLNISLPVDIFAAQSNLQRLAIGMTYGPIFLEKAVLENDPLQKLKWCISFGLTNSILYLNMEKPFNPILGQTFQGWMNGCPIYLEQISHHPPIASFLYLGRGYKISGSLQSKVQLHMNSGCGTTDGVYKIQFDNGTDICFITPGGELSGLAYGDRKFNLVNKSYYWSTKHKLFLELVFNPNKKGFFGGGKKQTPSDYFQGTVLQVTQNFINNLLSKKKKESPPSKQIVSQKSKVFGIWNKQLIIDGKKYLDTQTDIGCKLQYDKYLLPSDGYWRQDIAYRKLLNISKAQNEKQRLQVLQRNDRKLREKYHGKSQH